MAGLANSRVLVTPTSYARHDPNLREELEATVAEVVYNDRGRPLTSDELSELIPDFDGLIAGLDDIDRQVIGAASRLKVIARYGVGVDNVDLEAAAARGIVVCNTPGANPASVAELAIGLMLALARQLCRASAATKSGDWPRMSGTTIGGKVVGLVGFGAIGSTVAHRLQGFDCRVLAYDPYPDEERARELNVALVPLVQVQRQADFLSLHCPLTGETREFVDEAFLATMKPSALLINTARGELVDEEALAAALRHGQLAGAAIDVFQEQPPSLPHPLLDLPQVIATPHMGSHTDGAANALGWAALKECLAVLRGDEPNHRVV